LNSDHLALAIKTALKHDPARAKDMALELAAETVLVWVLDRYFTDNPPQDLRVTFKQVAEEFQDLLNMRSSLLHEMMDVAQSIAQELAP